MEAGTRLGPYEIVSPIGAGGMGEVWRARDTRLGRDVAIKILPAEFAADAKLKLRLEREAKTISHLSHPNICTLFDVGENFLVMELLEGETLADRLARGPLALPEVIRYGVQIAEALGKAHQQGVVHRDLKPANIMLTRSGAKLLDFGLAKSTIATPSAEGATIQKPLTQEGTVLGTFQYMSPEQLAGEEPDVRTDIFALGAVLYEMTTGQPAFAGKTRTSLIAAIVSGPVRPMRELQPLTPPTLEHVVTKCLQKEPDERWQSAADVAEELRWISQAGSDAGIAVPMASARRRDKSILIAAAVAGWIAALVAVVAAGIFVSRWKSAGPVMQLDVAQTIGEAQDDPLAISPDGRRIAAAVPAGRTLQLWVRDLSTPEGKLLPGTEGASYPFWAPDGHAIGFFADAKLRTINVETGAIQTLCDAPFGRGGTWSGTGIIVFAPNIRTAILKVSENGGSPVAVTKPEAGYSHRNPFFLPDGKHFLYCSYARPVNQLHVGSIEGNFDRKVLDYASNAAVVDGWLLTVREHNLLAQRFDAESFQFTGKPRVIAQNIDRYSARYIGTFSAQSNVLIYQRTAQPKRQFLFLDQVDGRATMKGEIASWSSPAISPNGRRVAVNRFDVERESAEFWMCEADTGTAARLTFAPHDPEDAQAVFSPDGQRVAISIGLPNREQWIQPAGGGTHTPILSGSESLEISDWSRDGKTLLISVQRSATGYDIERVDLDRPDKSVPLLHGRSDERFARFSPDKKWMAYASDESGRMEIYVADFPDGSGKWQVSTAGGEKPYWSSDGRQLYYLAGDRVFVATVQTGESFSVEPPTPVDALGDHVVDFAVAHNGRIVALREIDAGKPPLTLVLNWQRLLKAE